MSAVEGFQLLQKNLDVWRKQEGSEKKEIAIKKIERAYRKNLKYLNLCGLQLTRFPPIYGLTFLESLDISDNRISDIPEPIGQCRSLKKIDASNNVLVDVPQSIPTLTKLEQFNLSKNFFSDIPDQLGGLPDFCKIDLRGNSVGIFDIPVGANPQFVLESKRFAETA